jgi:hypothetical protein
VIAISFLGSTNNPSLQAMCLSKTPKLTQNAHFSGWKLMPFYLHFPNIFVIDLNCPFYFHIHWNRRGILTQVFVQIFLKKFWSPLFEMC